MATMRLLVVDDVALYRTWVVAAARAHAVVVSEARSGEDAVAAAARARAAGVGFAAAIVDLLMPQARVEGIAATRALIALDVPCLLYTTVTSARTRLEATLSGAIGYVVKDVPTARVLLAQTIADLVQRRPVRDPLPTLPLAAHDVAELTVRKRFVDGQLATLGDLERAVLRAATRGLSDAEIALTLGLPRAQVTTTVHAICVRLSLTSQPVR